MTTITVNKQGAIQLPQEVLRSLGWQSGSELALFVENNKVTIKSNEPINEADFSESVKRVGGMLAPFTDKRLTVEEINDSLAEMFSKRGCSQ